MSISLDLFSTSQTNRTIPGTKFTHRDRIIYDECLNNAPYFAYKIDGKKWGIVQGCCNDWLCPRCGQQRAREEYGRIVSGAREVSKECDLTMFTITCRGSDCSVEQAESNYLTWTNSLLSRLRAKTKRSNKKWAYASVTERQNRQHPHSHFLTTYKPDDSIFVAKGKPKYYYTQDCYFPAKHDTLQSESAERACVECGLGWQYDISELGSVEGASRYVAKYLFKETIFSTKWPKGWRRVRYSQSWPKLPDVKGDAMILLSKFDWYKLSRLAVTIITKDDGAKKMAQANLSGSDCFIL